MAEPVTWTHEYRVGYVVPKSRTHELVEYRTDWSWSRWDSAAEWAASMGFDLMTWVEVRPVGSGGVL